MRAFKRWIKARVWWAWAALPPQVSLSNKGCPNHYTGAPKPRCCPLGYCWYDEQVKRRADGQLALIPAAWLQQLNRKAK